MPLMRYSSLWWAAFVDDVCFKPGMEEQTSCVVTVRVEEGTVME